MPPPLVSAVLTVFDKADLLPSVLDRLRAEAGSLLGEVVAVDDGSKDASRERLAECAAAWPALRVLHDGANLGPSLRLNEGAAAARGEWLLLIDADGILRRGALAGLFRLAQTHGLDALHARVKRVQDLRAGAALGPFPAAPRLEVSERPLATLLARRGRVRMAWLVRRECFLAAGGADPAVFVQDESLPLRLAGVARRLGLCQAAAVFEPRARYQLSGDRRQTHHDRFLAHYRYLLAHPELPAGLQRRLMDRCFATARRAAAGDLLPDHSELALRFRRLLLRLGLTCGARQQLARIAALLAEAPRIRRPRVPA
jgi:glycosyltransferase involved in cell wall biosynthesis